MRKEIVIVGGGTAGWLVALSMEKLMGYDANVTLIESEDIGIIGAGEGSTPNLPGILNWLGIDFSEFFIKTNATHKIAISFENWNGDGKKYYHPFTALHNEFDWCKSNLGIPYIGYLKNKNLELDDFILSSKLAEENISPLVNTPINGKDTSSHFSFHFDARLVGEYLRKIGIKRKVKRIEGIVKEFTLDENNQIKKIILKDKTIIKCDFVCDCTGFNRLIVGKLFNTEWKSYEDKLKVNTAIPYFLPQSETIKPYTRAIAMKYGWTWQIPLQNRWGCGYNFDNSYCTIDEAKEEIIDYLGFEVKFGNPISFNAGRYKNVWVNNCIAFGLSMGFTEPIEATAIFNIINQISCVSKQNILDYINGDRIFYKEYNEWIAKINDDVVDFLQFHYFTKRTDTEFWKSYFETSSKSIALIKKLKHWKTNQPNESDFVNESFGLANWLCVGSGISFFNKKYFVEYYEKFQQKDKIKYHHKTQIENYKKIKDISISENEAINLIKKNYYNDKVNTF
jgi:tryptophan halogenase